MSYSSLPFHRHPPLLSPTLSTPSPSKQVHNQSTPFLLLLWLKRMRSKTLNAPLFPFFPLSHIPHTSFRHYTGLGKITYTSITFLPQSYVTATHTHYMYVVTLDPSNIPPSSYSKPLVNTCRPLNVHLNHPLSAAAWVEIDEIWNRLNAPPCLTTSHTPTPYGHQPCPPLPYGHTHPFCQHPSSKQVWSR